ncbi:MAG: hypothetical protein HRU19_30685 [Pseudobacteriovorax sp.]|nr:hypothetical protein [Pseudobacteriovorax sp.]
MRIFLIGFIFASSIACQSLSSDGSLEYEPEAGNFLVKYNPNGIERLVNERRFSAYKRMGQQCGGMDRFEIVNEEINDSGRDKGSTIELAGVDRLLYIEYKCR